MSVHPVRCPSVPFDFKALDEGRRRLVALDQFSDLCAGHRVTFDGRRVVDVVEPDLVEDFVRLDIAG
ncbi:MAG: hypothetical protein AUH69_03535 [Actinobacteria bacterium 13_1_40CM_4_65_12]|nr:MAG: hypothetical protein AUH69_03535 [Actinobacteria bacterium 13_1_40CM_4_65_12]